MPLFSVIIPLYNKQEYIGNTLQCVFVQTFTDFEIVIVNDGSTDGSETVVNSYNDPRIKYLKTANKGAASARNTAIEVATGKLMAFIDADDDWLPTHLETLYDLFCKYPDAGMYASRYYFKIPGDKLQKAVFNKISNGFSGIVPDFFASSLTHRVATSSSIAVQKDVFKIAGNFNENYTNGEDTDMWIRIGIHYPVVLSGYYTAVYNFHITNTLSKTALHTQKIMDFAVYKVQERTNNGLKLFLDLYRVEYAVKYRLAGNIKLSKALLEDTSYNNIPLKQKVLLNLPPFILRGILFVKKYFYNSGIVKV